MDKKGTEKIRGLLECVGIDKDINTYVSELKKLRYDIESSIDIKKKADYHKALGNETRYLIYNLITKKEMCICELETILDLSQPAISHHVKILEQSGLINGEKSRKFIHYKLTKV